MGDKSVEIIGVGKDWRRKKGKRQEKNKKMGVRYQNTIEIILRFNLTGLFHYRSLFY
jgi:hypothetical protein